MKLEAVHLEPVDYMRTVKVRGRAFLPELEQMRVEYFTERLPVSLQGEPYHIRATLISILFIKGRPVPETK